MNEIVFLGTGGGRWSTITQKRATGGFRLNLEEMNLAVDPGPGYLARSKQYGQDPQKVDAIFVSHAHVDHSTETNVAIEAMTRGLTEKRGSVIGSKSVFEKVEENGPIVSDFHKRQVFECLNMAREDLAVVNGVDFLFTGAEHKDSTTIGFKMKAKCGTISYTSDTSYFDGLSEQFKGTDVLIMNATRPGNERIPYHLCSDDIIKLVDAVKPKLAIMSYFGLRILKIGPIGEAKRVNDTTGIRTIAAEDGMVISMKDHDQSTLKTFGSPKPIRITGV
ncbi:TPA: MBL fold metallo-hydrolase [archaeon]|nr:MBL fold metallo-hydrolase [Candidatus Undinarchaeales archaeon SRR5007147.bin71]